MHGQSSLRINWFRVMNEGFQARIDAILRDGMQARKSTEIEGEGDRFRKRDPMRCALLPIPGRDLGRLRRSRKAVPGEWSAWMIQPKIAVIFYSTYGTNHAVATAAAAAAREALAEVRPCRVAQTAPKAVVQHASPRPLLGASSL